LGLNTAKTVRQPIRGKVPNQQEKYSGHKTWKQSPKTQYQICTMPNFAVYEREPGTEKFTLLEHFNDSEKAHRKASKQNLKNVQKQKGKDIPLVRVVPFEDKNRIPDKIHTIEQLDSIVKRNKNLFPKRDQT
jgi:hypothetical protein